MSNRSDVAKVGEGIAVAFVATIYGVASANIVFLPAANKLKIKHHEEMVRREMIMHGVLAIQQGEKPKLIVDRLSAFMHGHPAAPGHAGPKGQSKGQTKAAA
jgi:chemotaxis protein MotA